MNKEKIFFVDMDGVLTDLTSHALKVLNKELKKNFTIDDFIEYGEYFIYKIYKISEEKMWNIINEDKTFWVDLKPFPWSYILYNFLTKLGKVIILTKPQSDPECSKQKIEWLYKHLDVHIDDIMICSQKYLLAGKGILIDDSPIQVDEFNKAGGKAVLVPSNWNTKNLDYKMIMGKIVKNII